MAHFEVIELPDSYRVQQLGTVNPTKPIFIEKTLTQKETIEKLLGN